MSNYDIVVENCMEHKCENCPLVEFCTHEVGSPLPEYSFSELLDDILKENEKGENENENENHGR